MHVNKSYFMTYHTMIDIILRDLETTHQRDNDTFSEFFVRWRAKASNMMKMPNEKDQVNIVMKGLLPIYYDRIFASPIMDFEQLCNSRIRIEDAIDNGQLDKRVERISEAPKKIFINFILMKNNDDFKTSKLNV